MERVESRTIVSPWLMVNTILTLSGKHTSSKSGLVSVTNASHVLVSGVICMTGIQLVKIGPTVSLTVNEMASTSTFPQTSYATRSASMEKSTPHMTIIESGTGVPGHVMVSSSTYVPLN